MSDSRHSPVAAETLEGRVLLSAVPPLLKAFAVSDSEADLRWTFPGTPPSWNIVVERSQGTAAFQPLATLGPDDTSFSDTTLSPVTPYRYRLSTADGNGSVVQSNAVATETLPSQLTTTLPPLPPQTVESGSIVSQPVATGSFAGFWAVDTSGMERLWRTDGTAAGTTQISPTVALQNGNLPPQLISMGGNVYFVIGNLLYRSDGTDAGTSPIATLYSGYSCTVQVLVAQNYGRPLSSTATSFVRAAARGRV